MLAAETNIIMDPDVADCAGYATRRLDELIARPAKPGETDDMPLIIENLRYDPQAPGGSHADYIADHIEAAYAGIPVKAPDRTQLEQETRQHILETALDPNRELHKLGLEPVQLGEHTNAYTGPQPEDWVGITTRKLRNAAMKPHGKENRPRRPGTMRRRRNTCHR